MASVSVRHLIEIAVFRSWLGATTLTRGFVHSLLQLPIARSEV